MKSKNIKITHANYSATSNAILTQNARATWTYIFSIYVLRLELSMVIDVTEKHQKQMFYSRKKKPFFRSLKLVTLLLSKEMLVLTSY